LTGRKRDVSHYINPANEITNFVYSGNPAEPSEWSMCSEETEPVDSRILMSMGPMRMLPGQSNLMVFALVVQPQPELPCIDIGDLVDSANLPSPSNFSNFFCNLTVDTQEENLRSKNLSVFPNPASDQINFQLSVPETFASIRLYTMHGQLVRKENNLQSSKMVLFRNELAAGTYIYQIQTLAGDSVSGKIMLK